MCLPSVLGWVFLQWHGTRAHFSRVSPCTSKSAVVLAVLWPWPWVGCTSSSCSSLLRERLFCLVTQRGSRVLSLQEPSRAKCPCGLAGCARQSPEDPLLWVLLQLQHNPKAAWALLLLCCSPGRYRRGRTPQKGFKGCGDKTPPDPCVSYRKVSSFSCSPPSAFRASWCPVHRCSARNG